MNNYAKKQIAHKEIYLVLIAVALFIIHYSLFTQKVNAQSAISLSITPPIVEVMIAPGKDIKQTFTISNDGGSTLISPKIVYFTPSDNAGNVDLADNSAPDWIKYDKTPFNLISGGKYDFKISIEPPLGTPETDHFLTLIFENDVPTDILGQSSTLFTSQIGSNILLTVSKDGNPKKSAEIIKFTAPKIVDSFFTSLEYDITIGNNGNSYWKPQGKVIVLDQTLNLAEQNVLSGTQRSILCISNETLEKCKSSNKFHIGNIKSTLEFQMDDDQKIYKIEENTFAFPFILVIIIIFLLTSILRKWIFKR